MTHKMTNEQIKEQYKKHGGDPIVHETNDDNRPATLKEILTTAAFVIAGCAASALVFWLVF